MNTTPVHLRMQTFSWYNLTVRSKTDEMTVRKEGFCVKLMIAIVQDEDAGKLIGELMDQNFGVTKLATTGGFLKSGNTTLLIGLEEERYEECLALIEKVCKSRKQLTTSPVSMNGVSAGMYSTFPIEVTVGGATVFVLSVDQFVKF